MRQIRKHIAQHEITKTTAAVLITGLLVAGGVVIWAPQETAAALIGLAGTVLAAVLPSLLRRRAEKNPDVREQLERASQEPEEPNDR
jgi:uncharacterized membrane protein YraQ (UPF0718 family)